MSLWDRWFGKSPSTTPKPQAPAAQSMYAESLHTAHGDLAATNQPLVSSRTVVIDGGAPRPGERSARREMMYSAVRESMMRSSILSSGYKFKVLALDKRATEFIVMVDVADQFASTPDKLAQIEALIAYSAKSRFDLMVKSVYWRLNSQLSVLSVKSKAPTGGATHAMTDADVPAPVSAPVSMPVAAPPPGIDPIEQAEIEAFKKALLDAAMAPVAPLTGGAPQQSSAPQPRPAPIVPSRAPATASAPSRSHVPPPSAETNFGGLSTTQYGDLN